MSRFTGLALGIAGLAATACGPEEGIANKGRHLQSASVDAGMNFGADTFVADSAVFERTNTINQAVAGSITRLSDMTDLHCDPVVPSGVENGMELSSLTGTSDAFNPSLSINPVLGSSSSSVLSPGTPNVDLRYEPFGDSDSLRDPSDFYSFSGNITNGTTNFFVDSSGNFMFVDPTLSTDPERGLYSENPTIGVTYPFSRAELPDYDVLNITAVTVDQVNHRVIMAARFSERFTSPTVEVLYEYEVDFRTLTVGPITEFVRIEDGNIDLSGGNLYTFNTINFNGPNGPVSFIVAQDSTGGFITVEADGHINDAEATYDFWDSSCANTIIKNADGSTALFNGRAQTLSDLYFGTGEMDTANDANAFFAYTDGMTRIISLKDGTYQVEVPSTGGGDTGVDGGGADAGYPDATADAGGYTPDTSDGFSGSDADAGGYADVADVNFDDVEFTELDTDTEEDVTDADAGGDADVADVNFDDVEFTELDTDTPDAEEDTDTVQDVEPELDTDTPDAEEDTDTVQDVEPELDTDTPEEDVDAGTPDSGPERPVDVPNNYTPDAGTDTPEDTVDNGETTQENPDQGGGCSAVQEQTSSRINLIFAGLIAIGSRFRRRKNTSNDKAA